MDLLEMSPYFFSFASCDPINKKLDLLVREWNRHGIAVNSQFMLRHKDYSINMYNGPLVEKEPHAHMQ